MNEIEKLVVVFIIIAVLLLFAWAVEEIRASSVSSAGRRLVAIVLCSATLLLALGLQLARSRDLDGRYAASPLKQWFDQLRSGKGPCCSDADGTALSDVDWEAKDGRYRVRIEGQWWNVPDEAVITEPNRAGHTMVWPIYNRALGGVLSIDIRCFMPGSMT
ncbi:hypothetical protein QMZ05_40510 [Bradyrhizobium sp. INPA03-11B]|uniref:hypothetical protein n=1 Tax=Bradyrhizobium sp. INPA03-11B TaxID=418598 RepID=UPI00338DA5BB